MLLKPKTFRSLCRARDVLHQMDEDPPTIEALARQVAMSPFHFIRQFEAVFGVTPHQFRIQSRLDRAKRLLAVGGHSVTDVCLDVGFSSLGSFSDLFTRRVGVTPSAYRRRMRTFVQVPGTMPPDLTPGCLSLMAGLPAWAFRSFREAPAPPVCQTQRALIGGGEAHDAHQAHEHHGR
jgi:AraC-like DNA-binding protein